MLKFFLGVILCCIVVFGYISNSYSWVLNINNVQSYINYLNSLSNLNKSKVVNKKLVNKDTVPQAGSSIKTKVVSMSIVSNSKVKSVAYKRLKVGSSVKSVSIIKKPVIRLASINGSSNGLPVVSVNFKNKPLWQVLQYVSNKTGYIFKVKHINLVKNVTISGRYNLANFLAYIFNGKSDKTTLNVRSKKVIVER